jgi:signal transduction histidine kinase
VSARPERRGISLRATLLAAFAYVLILVIVALEVPLVTNISKRVDSEIKADAFAQAQLIATTANDDLDRPPVLQQLVEDSARDLGGRVIVTDDAGRLLADSAGPGLRGDPYASRPEIAQALDGETAQDTRESESLGESILFTAVPVIHNRQRAGAVRVTQSVGAVQDEVRDDALALIGVGLVALLLGMGVAWVLAGSLARAPRQLAATARRVAGGDLGARAPEAGPREEREVSAAFNEMTARLEASLEAQRDFVANASHQLRTPLTGLQLRIEAASRKAASPEAEEDLREAELELERLSGLLTNLLALARGDESPGEGHAIALGQAARAAAERWSSRADRRGQAIEVDCEPGLEVLATGEDLGIVFDNLIENAITYSPRGSEIALRCRRAGGYGSLIVEDMGPGLDPGEAERVVERFYRGDAGTGQPGTGLGLAIVSTLARRWGGGVRLANRDDGSGLRAEVRLPLTDEGLTSPGADLAESLPTPSSLDGR